MFNGAVDKLITSIFWNKNLTPQEIKLFEENG